MVDLSTGTGGQAVRSDSPAFVTALTRAITGFVLANADWDCNDNGVLDECDIADGTSYDLNENGIPDECEDLCIGDVDGNGVTNTSDLLALLAAWGDCPDPPEECPADIYPDGVVNTVDLLTLLADWGCPAENPPPPPRSIQDCIDRYLGEPEKLEACIEAMIRVGTP